MTEPRSNPPAARPPRLLLEDYGRVVRWGAVRVMVGPGAPPAIAVVREEDTYRVLAAPVRDLDEPGEDLTALAPALCALTPARPGTVRIRAGDPPLLAAVIHDLDREPTWREDWIVAAWRVTLRETVRHRIRSLAAPLLGTVHGRLPARRAAALLASALRTSGPHEPLDLHLVRPEGDAPEVRGELARRLAR